MRGSLVRRYKGSWSIVLDLRREPDPVTGRERRKQKWITFRDTYRAAEKKLADLLRNVNRGEYVEPTKLTVGEWLDEWLEKAIKPPMKRHRTHYVYKRIIEGNLKPALGTIRLQVLKP